MHNAGGGLGGGQEDTIKPQREECSDACDNGVAGRQSDSLMQGMQHGTGHVNNSSGRFPQRTCLQGGDGGPN